MATWDKSKARWKASAGTGANRRFFYSKKTGQQGHDEAERKKREYLEGPAPLAPGSFGEFFESVFWPSKRYLTRSTLIGYKSIAETHFPRFYTAPLVSLRFELLQGWVNGLIDSGLTPKRVANIWSLMRSCLEMASRLGRIHGRDYSLVELPKSPRRKARRDLNQTLIAKLIEAAPDYLAGPIWTAAYLGLRRNEVCGLWVNDVEVLADRAIIHVRRNRQKHGETNKLKSKAAGEERRLCVPRPWGQKLLSFASGESTHIFSGLDGLPINPDRLTKCMAPICAKAKAPKITFHDLRAAAASNLRAAGVSETVIMDFLGHRRVDVTLLYMDRRDEDILSATERLGM